VFKNLRTSTKLFILCTMFMIAIGVTTYGLFREKLIAIEFARKELGGTKYLEAVRKLSATVLAGRPFDASAASSSDTVSPRRRGRHAADGRTSKGTRELAAVVVEQC